MTQQVRALATLTLMLWLTAAICIGDGRKPESGNSASGVDSARTAGKKRKLKGVGNFGEVTPMLFRGAQPSPRGFQALAKSGIDIVVDTRGNRSQSEGKRVHRLGMQYVAIPWHCPFPHDEVFARFLKIIRAHPEKKIFVHCRLGDDRTGMMIAAYRMAAQGWTAEEAMREMQEFGFTRAHHFICPGLASYEQNFPAYLKTHPAFRGVR